MKFFTEGNEVNEELETDLQKNKRGFFESANDANSRERTGKKSSQKLTKLTKSLAGFLLLLPSVKKSV